MQFDNHNIASIIYIFHNTFKRFYKYHKYKHINITHNNYNNYAYFFYNYLKKNHFFDISLYQSNELLILLLDNYKLIKKLTKQFGSKRIIAKLNQNGGFIYNKYDSVYTKILNMVDVIMSFASLILSSNSMMANVLQPYLIVSGFMNLLRKEYVLAFYSAISIISYVGMSIGSSLKIIHYIVSYVMTYRETKKKMIHVDEKITMRELNRILINYEPSNIYIPTEGIETIENEVLLIK